MFFRDGEEGEMRSTCYIPFGEMSVSFADGRCLVNVWYMYNASSPTAY